MVLAASRCQTRRAWRVGRAAPQARVTINRAVPAGDATDRSRALT
jgi:hypothetical protein